MSTEIPLSASVSPILNNRKRGRFFPSLGRPREKQLELASAANPIVESSSEVAEALELLASTLGDRFARNKLIAAVAKLELSPNPTSMIRFCVGVDEFEKTKDKIEKKSKGRKLVAMFIQGGSMFQLPNPIPNDVQRGLIQEKYDYLLLMKALTLSELASNAPLIGKVKEMEL